MKYIEPAIFELLKNVSPGNVHMLRAPDGAPGPFVIIQRINGERWRDIRQATGVARVSIQVDCYAQEYYAARDMALAVEQILESFHGTVTNQGTSYDILGSIIEDEQDIFDKTDDPYLYRASATYGVTYRQ